MSCLLPAIEQIEAPAVETSSRDVRVRLAGTFQPLISIAWQGEEPNITSRIGFGVRRARLRVRAEVGPHAGGSLQLGVDSGLAQMLDAFVFYEPSDAVRLRFGRLVSAQPRASQPTSHTNIDAIERASISALWGRKTIGSDGRDFGIELRYRTPQSEMLLFLHNGDGNWDRLRGNVRGDVLDDPTRGVNRTPSDMAVSAAVRLTPASLAGVELGGFAGYNGSRNPNTEMSSTGRRYNTYAGHAYWGADPGSQPVRFKADVIGIVYEKEVGEAQHSLGVALTGAYLLHRAAELFVRGERYTPDLSRSDDVDFFLHAGVSFSPSAWRGGSYHAERLTIGYSGRFPENDAFISAHLVVLQAQIVF